MLPWTPRKPPDAHDAGLEKSGPVAFSWQPSTRERQKRAEIVVPANSDHKLVYRGQLDGARPGNRVPVTGEDLRAAMDAVLGAKPVALAAAEHGLQHQVAAGQRTAISRRISGVSLVVSGATLPISAARSRGNLADARPSTSTPKD